MSTFNKGAPGTTEQRPTWEGPPENRPAGYLPAEDNPERDRDASGENLQDPDRSDLSDAVATTEHQPREDRIRARAYRLWEQDGQREGSHEDHWYQAERDIDQEDRGAGPEDAEQDRRPAEEFPPFDDPAFSPKPAQPSLGSVEPAFDETVPDNGDDLGLAEDDAYQNPASFEGIASPSDGDRAEADFGHGATPSPSTEKSSGAGPAIAERSKDAKAPRAGRQPGAYVKK